MQIVPSPTPSSSKRKLRMSATPDAETVLQLLPAWLAHYNELHPHRALSYRSPRELIRHSTREDLSANYGATTAARSSIPCLIQRTGLIPVATSDKNARNLLLVPYGPSHHGER